MDDGQTIDDHFWIVYGKKGSKMSIVPLIFEYSDKNKKLLCGMSYHEYRVADDEECVMNLARQELDVLTLDYCSHLLYRERKNHLRACMELCSLIGMSLIETKRKYCPNCVLLIID